MGTIFSASSSSSSKKRVKKDMYIDERRSYKKPKRKISKKYLNILISDRVVSYVYDPYDVFAMSLISKESFLRISKMELFWFHSCVLSLGLGDWRWFFDKKKKYDLSKLKTWMEVHSILRSIRIKHVADELFLKAFPEKLKFGKEETWEICKSINRNRMDSLFCDLMKTYSNFNEGRGDNQCDIYPIGIAAYVRRRTSKSVSIFEAKGKDFLNNIKTLTKHLESVIYDPLEYPSIDSEEAHESFQKKGPSLKKYIENPDVNFVHMRDEGREFSEMSFRIILSKMYGFVIQKYIIHEGCDNHTMVLKILHEAIENAVEEFINDDMMMDFEDGIRPENMMDDMSVFYTSDLIAPLQKLLKKNLTVEMFPKFPSWKQYNVIDYSDEACMRLQQCASSYLKRVNKLMGSDEDKTQWLLLSDSDRMPYGPQSNDHNGVVYLALVSKKWVWVIMGKSNSC